jgi:signal transduction histidine kinase
VAIPPKTQLNLAGTDPHASHILVDAELMESESWLIRLRWLAGIGVLVVVLGIDPLLGLQAGKVPLLGIGFTILFYNAIFFGIDFHLRHKKAAIESYRLLTVWQVTLDWLAMSLLIHFSGGIESPAIFFFLFHIVIASMFFPVRTAFSFSFLAIGLVSAIALLEYFSILPHRATGGYLTEKLYANPYYVTAILVFFSSTGIILAYLATAISERLRRRESEVVLLTHSLQQATTRLQALNEGARTITSSLDLSQVLKQFAQITSEVLGIRACSIRLLDKTGKRLEPVATYGLSQEYLDKGPIDLDTNQLARQVLEGKIINIPDVSESTLLQYPEWAKQEGISSMLSAPLVGKTQSIGILRAYAQDLGHFTSDDEEFLASIAAQGSIAIENAQAYQAIETLDANKSNFVRMVTHELRSPVSVARSLLRTLTAGYAGEVSSQQQDILERASRRLDFLQKLIDDLLDLATGKSDIIETRTSAVDMFAVIRRVIERFRLPAEEKGVSLAFSEPLDHSVATVLATPDGLDRVFNNLISNAVKYTPPGGKVNVTASCSGNNIQVEISDTGIGIPEDAQGHLFEEFYRAPNAKEMDREGTGLGLTIVRDIVTRFEGTIRVQSRVGEGTQFTVIFPSKSRP